MQVQQTDMSSRDVRKTAAAVTWCEWTLARTVIISLESCATPIEFSRSPVLFSGVPRPLATDSSQSSGVIATSFRGWKTPPHRRSSRAMKVHEKCSSESVIGNENWIRVKTNLLTIIRPTALAKLNTSAAVGRISAPGGACWPAGSHAAALPRYPATSRILGYIPAGRGT